MIWLVAIALCASFFYGAFKESKVNWARNSYEWSMAATAKTDNWKWSEEYRSFDDQAEAWETLKFASALILTLILIASLDWPRLTSRGEAHNVPAANA